jgi:hypothetical protein
MENEIIIFPLIHCTHSLLWYVRKGVILIVPLCTQCHAENTRGSEVPHLSPVSKLEVDGPSNANDTSTMTLHIDTDVTFVPRHAPTTLIW